MLIDTFANRLQKAMNNCNMKQVELVEKSKLDKSLISNYLSGKYKAKQDKLTILANILGVSETWLMGYDVPMTVEEMTFDNCNMINIISNTVSIPVLGYIKAGIPIEAQESILGYVDIPKSWTNGDKKYYALKINGDSMYPKYNSNDVVIFLMCNDCESGKDCAVMVNGYDATFKKVIKQDNGILLQPYNNDYEAKFYSKEEIQSLPIKILGVAKEQRINLN